MAKILVTGGAGYIGSHVCKLLAEQGHTPITYDNLCRGFKTAVQWGPLIEGDILDKDNLKKTLKAEQPEAVMHFAAYAYVGESVEKPDMYFRNNVHGSQSLLAAMEETDLLHRLVFSSSCATYGIPEKLPIREDMPQAPINPYGESKLQVEKILIEKSQQSDFKFSALRYFNAAGCDPDGEIGENHDPEPHIIPNTIKAGLGLREKLEIFGKDYPTPDGTTVRDYIHVTDLAQAHILILDTLLNNKKIHPFYNIGNNKGFSLLEILKETEKVLEKPIPYEFAEKRPGDPPTLIGSAEKFKKDFNWQPQSSDIQTIIQTAADWIQKGQ